MPFGEYFLSYAVVLGCATLFGFFLFRPLRTVFADTLHHSLMIFLGIITSGLYNLIIFVIMNVWGYLQEVSKNATLEASTLESLIGWTSQHDDTLSQQALQSAALYVALIRGPEWRAMSLGYTLPEERQAWYALNRAVFNLSKLPGTVNSLYISRSLTYLENLTCYRNFRIQGINSIVPVSLRRAIITFSVLVACLLGIFCRTKDLPSMIAIGTFNIFLAFVLSLALMIDFPYSGIAVNRDIYYSGILQRLPDIDSKGLLQTGQLGKLP